MKVKVVNKSKYPLPQYATAGSAGMDLRANIDDTIVLQSMQRIPMPTGLYMELPVGTELQIRPRSGLALKHGVTVCNSPGTIDSDYRGEIGVILINLGSEPFVINPGDRIAQGVFAKYEQGELIRVEELSKTDRGEGGFGHTGQQ